MEHGDIEDRAVELMAVYDAPECIFQIMRKDGVEALRGRLWMSPGHDFIEFDKSRWFVRALFPIPVDGGPEFKFGVWLELPSKAEFFHLMEVWNDAVAYEKLSFECKLANTLERDDAIGSYVHGTGGPDVNQKPRVVGSESSVLHRLLTEGWTKAEHERVIGRFDQRS